MSLLSVDNLRVEYALEHGSLCAAKSVDLTVEAGSTVGLVGESGSGKTTLALSLMGLLPRNGQIASGTITFDGTDVTALSESEWRQLRWSRISLIFQGGMNALNPVKPVLDQIVEPIVVHDPSTSQSAARDWAKELLARVGIPAERARAYPHEYSGGMRQRACLAMALACRPQLVIADEPVTALDVVVQAQIIRLLGELRDDFGLTLLVISHDLGVVAQLCDHVLVMYAAEIVERGTVRDIFHRPQHPYTQLLLDSVPRIGSDRTVGQGVPGAPPSLASPPAGCRLHPRCPSVMPQCRSIPPGPQQFGPEHWASCHLYDTPPSDDDDS